MNIGIIDKSEPRTDFKRKEILKLLITFKFIE